MKISLKEYYKGQVYTVTAGVRFGHHIVDLIAVYGMSYAIEYLYFLAASGPNLITNNYYIISMFAPYLYYFLMEVFFQQTLGKMISKTVVVNEYGEKASVGQILARTLCRIIPFEAFSCMGDFSRGWHDKIPKTYVMSKIELEDALEHIQAMEDGENAHLYQSLVDDK